MDAFVNMFIKGGPVMWPLLACSLLAMTFVIERVFFWWRERHRIDEELTERILSLTEEGCFEEAIHVGGEHVDMYAQVLRRGLEHRQHGLTEAMQIESAKQISRMKQGLSLLDTIITLAPLLGILGTVTGIIKSFDLLGQSGVDDPKAVSGGIAEALITTAAGLVVAIFTLLPFNYFVSKTQAVAGLLEKVATQMEVAYRKSRAKVGNGD